jgi:hypothetical protein
MKRISFLLIGFVSLFLLSVPLFGQSKSIETFLVDDFDTQNPTVIDGRAEKTFSWAGQGSKFLTKVEQDPTGPYPKVRWVPGIPNALKVTRAEDAPEAKVLGVQVKFNQKADNWFEVYPVDAEGKPYGIPMRTTVQNIDFWVWGGNYNYTLEVLIRDVGGVVHVLPAGSLKFEGWKNVILNIPSKVMQKGRAHTTSDVLRLVGFRVRTSPQEMVDDFTVFFDQLKYTSSVIANIYDGYDLRNINFDEGAGQ